jgi:hypothetical protein
VTDRTESVKFVGGVEVRGWNFIGFRGRGAVFVSAEGIDFALNQPWDRFMHKYVKRVDLADVYAVQAKRLSLSSLIAAVIPHQSNTGIRFLTPPVGMFADRDVYTCFPDNDGLPKLIDLLEELGYPVDRRVKTYRIYWGSEA